MSSVMSALTNIANAINANFDDIMNNNILFKECKGMNAQELKKELRKRKLDSSYNGSKRELIQRIEKFVKDDIAFPK